MRKKNKLLTRIIMFTLLVNIIDAPITASAATIKGEEIIVKNEQEYIEQESNASRQEDTIEEGEITKRGEKDDNNTNESISDSLAPEKTDNITSDSERDNSEVYNVNFIVDNIIYESVSVRAGYLIPIIVDPIRDGYFVKGWSSSEDGNNTWNFEEDVMPPHDLNLYIQWMPTKQTITFSPGYYGDASKLPAAIKAYTDEVVDLSSVPKPVIADMYKNNEYIYFSGIWCYRNSDNVIIYLESDMLITMPPEGIVLYPYTREVNPYRDIKIQASNVTFTVDEYRKYLGNDSLKSEILIRSCPKNYTSQAISILLLELKMDNLPSDGLIGKYAVTIKYPDGNIGLQPVDIIVEIINNPMAADQGSTLQKTTNSIPQTADILYQGAIFLSFLFLVASGIILISGIMKKYSKIS